MLAGGASRRLGGSPKGLEKVGGTRIVDRVASALEPATSKLVLVANDPDAQQWLPRATLAADTFRGGGGLAGVHAALKLSAGADIVAVAWDMPFVSTGLIRILIGAAREADAVIAVPEGDSPFGVEPFCAYYSARVLEPLTEFLTEGGGAAHTFLQKIGGVTHVPSSALRQLGDPAKLLMSVNTAQDLERARAMESATE